MLPAGPAGPVVPTGAPTPPAVAEAKARRRRERKERNLKGIQDDKVRKERLENRKRLKEQLQEEEAEKSADLQLMDDLTQLKVWLGRGVLRFQQVQNVTPGWIFAYETGEGQAMSVDQYGMYEKAAQMGLPLPKPPVWWQVGLLKYPLAQQTLSSVGFGQFVNFFGEPWPPRWAMEIPLAMELGLFIAAWVNPIPLVDSDWESGGAGPFLMGVSASMIEEARVDPAAAAMNEEQEKEAREYTAKRLQRPGAAEADRPLQLQVPESELQRAPTTEKEDSLFYYVDGAPGPPLLFAVRKLVESIAAFAIQNEAGDSQEQKIETFMDRMKLDFVEDDTADAPEMVLAERNMWNIYMEIDSMYRPTFNEFVQDVIELVVKAGPPEGGWPNVAAPGHDQPPPPGLTVAQVQQATAQKQATAPPPAPQEYHSMTDYMKTLMGRDALNLLTKSASRPDFETVVRSMLPPILMREMVFFVRIGQEFAPGTRADAFFSDNQNPIDEPTINLGPAYGNPPSFTMDDVFIQTVKANGYREYSVAADDPESFGLFGYKQMEHLYEHLFLKAKPLFSVAPGKAVQFFPSSYVCSNVWWWESKLEMVPLGTTWKQEGRGGFNFAYKLQIESLSPVLAAMSLLPPLVSAYGTDGFYSGVFPTMLQYGLIKRVAWVKPDDRSNITNCMRELYLAGYAASCGVGPKILAAYIQPGGSRPGYAPEIKMNPGDPEERFASPLYEPKQNSRSDAVWNEADSPPEGWMQFKGPWSEFVKEHNKGTKVLEDGFHPSYNLMVKEPNVNRRDPRSYAWKKMVVVMESYEGDMDHFSMPRSAGQRKKTVEALMKTFSKMGEAGLLHCDIKSPNVVYRTWTTGKSVGWSNIETMAIDFDPEFVKLVPWLPGPVIAFINAVCFFAWDACFRKGRFQKYTKEPLEKLHKEVMDNYPSGVAEAFRALIPSDMYDIPFEENNVQPYWLSSLFNDPFETANTFFHWVRMYLNKSCTKWIQTYEQAPPNASMLARLLAMAQYKDPKKALEPPDAAKRGNFPFELHADPEVRKQMVMEASATVWGGMKFDPPETSSWWGWSDSDSDSESESDGEAEEDPSP